MQKKIQLPKEQVNDQEAPGFVDENDVEGHGGPASPETLYRRLPGTGGEVVEDDDQSPNGVRAR